MAVTYGGTTVTSAEATGTSATSPAITTPTTNPVVIVYVTLKDGTATVSSVTHTWGAGTVMDVGSIRTDNFTFEELTHIWAIVAPTANSSGTVTANFSASVANRIAVNTFSGADQSSPIGNVQTSILSGDATLTPTGLTTIDATAGAESMDASPALFDVAPNTRFTGNGTTVGLSVGDATGTTGVTFTNAGSKTAKVAVRIISVPAGPPGGSFTQQILRSRLREW